MPGTYSKLVTVATGQTITASERNNEHDNHINNATPDGVDDASANLAAMQATADPSGGSLATTLRGEIQRLRFQLIKLGAASGNWYDALPFLAGVTPAAAGASATDLNNRLAQIVSQIKNLGGLTNWYDSVTAALLKVGGTMSGAIAMGSNKITGLTSGSAAGEAATFGQLAVIQTKSSTVTTSTTTSSATYVDTVVTLSFTPTSASNKVLVSVVSSASNGTTIGDFQCALFRNSTDLFGGTTLRAYYPVFNPGSLALQILDSPATTSAITYQVKIKSIAGSIQIGNSAPSTITCQEVIP